MIGTPAGTEVGFLDPALVLGLTGNEALGQGHRKVDEAVKILLTANSGEERLAMKSRFFVSAPMDSWNGAKGRSTLRLPWRSVHSGAGQNDVPMGTCCGVTRPGADPPTLEGSRQKGVAEPTATAPTTPWRSTAAAASWRASSSLEGLFGTLAKDFLRTGHRGRAGHGLVTTHPIFSP